LANIVIISGGFDPLHAGHLQYINAAKKLTGKTGKLVIGLNSDEWLQQKKDYVAITWDERALILSNLAAVDDVIGFDDSDRTAIDAIQQVLDANPKDKIIFANGGDRTKDNIPEMSVKNVTFKFGVGGKDKVNSSSDIIINACNQMQESVTRKWGSYRILYNRPDCKVKELTVAPGKGISLQKHFIRSETWQLIDGELEVKIGPTAGRMKKSILRAGDIITIPYETWHVMTNLQSVPAVLIEIQSGSHCVETDIEHFDK